MKQTIVRLQEENAQLEHQLEQDQRRVEHKLLQRLGLLLEDVSFRQTDWEKVEELIDGAWKHKRYDRCPWCNAPVENPNSDL